MKSLVELLEILVQECARKVGAPCRRDVETLRRRAKHEGDSFITITLPNFCRDFERSLDEGRIAPGSFLSFGKTATGIPRFLQGFLRNVFDGTVLADEPSIDCISYVRQICLFCKKVQRSCSKGRNVATMDEFVHCDQSLGNVDPELFNVFGSVSDILMDDLEHLDHLTDGNVEGLWPHHGPGATQEHISGNQKWHFGRWHKRLEDVGFTYQRYGRAGSNPSFYFDPDGVLRIDGVWPTMVDPEDEAPSRVALVPKTLKTPRVIAVEPVCMQYAQQALKDRFVECLERHSITAGHVNFRDQSVNQALAMDASSCGLKATLDMSEASDRVSQEHVERLLRKRPIFRSIVFAARSSRAKLPDGRLVDLRKFASMGSALCFPFEALVFFLSIIASRIYRGGCRCNRQSVFSKGRDVYVYGDDLIVPADEAPAICTDLEALGFKVNRRKSFWTGKFRESCGLDAYDGVPVTPVYLRRDVPTDRTDVSGILSTMATAEQLYSAGLFETSAALRREVEKILGKLPRVPVDSPAIGWHHHSEVMPPKRWNSVLMRWEYRCSVVVPPRTADPLEGTAALTKCLVRFGESNRINVFGREIPLVAWYDAIQNESDGHLETSVRPYSLNLKRRWVAFT